MTVYNYNYKFATGLNIQVVLKFVPVVVTLLSFAISDIGRLTVDIRYFDHRLTA